MANISLPVDWSAIRSAIENGVPFDKVAAKFGVKSGTLRQKAARGGWVTRKDFKTAVSGANNVKSNVEIVHSEAQMERGKGSKETVLALIEESLSERGAAYERMIEAKMVPLMKAATIVAPKTWKDAETADKLIRRALHLESGDNQVNVAIVPGAWAAMNVKTIDSRNSGGPTFGVDSTESPSLTLDIESDSEVG